METKSLTNLEERVQAGKAEVTTQLENCDWSETLASTVSFCDSLEAKKNDMRKVSREKDNDSRNKESISNYLSNEEKQLEAFATLLESVGSDTTTIDLSKFGYNFMHDIQPLENRPAGAAEWDLYGKLDTKILDLFSTKNVADTKRRSSVTITSDELEYLKKYLPIAIRNSKDKCEYYKGSLLKASDRLDKNSQKYNEICEELKILEAKYLASISVLDKREVADGAPEYGGSDAAPQERYQSYIDRISWRYKKLQALDQLEIQYGRTEYGRKWAILFKQGDEYLLINKGTIYDNVKPLTIILNRVPEETYAIYTEAATSESKIVLMSILINGLQTDVNLAKRSSFARETVSQANRIIGQLTQY